MASIPLPALHIQPPSDPSEGLQRALMLQNMMQEAQQRRALMPGQLQIQQQQVQTGAADLQIKQQQIKNTQAGIAAMQEWDGKNPDDLVGLTKKYGADANTVIGLKNNIIKQKQDLANLDKDQLANEATRNDQLLGHIDAIKGITDPTQRAQVAKTQAFQILQNGLAKDPGMVQTLQAIASGQLVPDDNQVNMFEKGLTGHKAAIEEALKNAQTTEAQQKGRQAEAEGSKAQMEVDLMKKYGFSTPGQMDAKFIYLLSNQKQGLPVAPQDQAFMEAYKQQKLMVPIASANVRIAGLEQAREYPVINKQTGELEMRNAAEINASKGQYAPAGEGAKAMGKTALIEDIRGNISSVRDSLKNPQLPEFTADQRAEIAIALGKPEAQGALSAAFRGGVLGSLTSEQQDYLIKMAQLKENAMAMRSVLGAGQGSEDLRAAITATIPGPRTPSKQFALKQLDQFEAVLNRLERGIPNVPLRPTAQGAKTYTAPAGAQTATGPNGHKIVVDNGRWVDAETGQPIK